MIWLLCLSILQTTSVLEIQAGTPCHFCGIAFTEDHLGTIGCPQTYSSPPPLSVIVQL